MILKLTNNQKDTLDSLFNALDQNPIINLDTNDKIMDLDYERDLDEDQVKLLRELLYMTIHGAVRYTPESTYSAIYPSLINAEQLQNLMDINAMLYAKE